MPVINSPTSKMMRPAWASYDVKVGASYQLDTKFAGYKVTVIAKPANAVSFTTRRLQVPMRPGM